MNYKKKIHVHHTVYHIFNLRLSISYYSTVDMRITAVRLYGTVTRVCSRNNLQYVNIMPRIASAAAQNDCVADAILLKKFYRQSFRVGGGGGGGVYVCVCMRARVCSVFPHTWSLISSSQSHQTKFPLLFSHLVQKLMDNRSDRVLRQQKAIVPVVVPHDAELRVG